MKSIEFENLSKNFEKPSSSKVDELMNLEGEFFTKENIDRGFTEQSHEREKIFLNSSQIEIFLKILLRKSVVVIRYT